MMPTLLDQSVEGLQQDSSPCGEIQLEVPECVALWSLALFGNGALLNEEK